MKTLKELLLVDETRPTVVADSERVIEEEVASKTGVSGLAVKGAFKIVKAFKPGMIRSAVDGLLDDFVERMEPYYATYEGKSAGDLERHVITEADDIAESLLGVTDERARRSDAKTLKKAYEKLRPTGKKNVIAALPRVARMLAKHGA